jgi:hypothetical protein
MLKCSIYWKLVVTQLIKKLIFFYGPRSWLPSSQEPAVGLYPKPDECGLQPYFNIIFPPMLISDNWHVSLNFEGYKMLVYVFLVIHTYCLPPPFHPPWFDLSIVVCRRKQIVKPHVVQMFPFCLLRTNILRKTLFSNTLYLPSSFRQHYVLLAGKKTSKAICTFCILSLISFTWFYWIPPGKCWYST